MAKERLTLYDKYGNVIEYDISAASITIDAEGKQLDIKLTELADTIAAAIKSVTFNGNSPSPDNNGNVNLGQQMQADWDENNPEWPSYIRNKPSLANVATSGDYNDLRNKPTIPEGAQTDSQMSDTSEAPVQNKVIKAYVDAVSQRIDTLIGSGNVQGAIDTFNEVVAFLNGISSSDTLAAKLLLKANAADVYTMTQTDEAIADAVEGLGGGSVESVTINGQVKTPDSQGNIDLGTVVGQQGPAGNTYLVDENFDPVSMIINNLDESDGTVALSARQGKILKAVIIKVFNDMNTVLNALAGVAFTNLPKPTLDPIDWSGGTFYATVVKNLSGCTATDNTTNGQIAEGSTLTMQLTASSGYTLTGATISVTDSRGQSVAYTLNGSTLSVANVMGTINISVVAVAVYSVTNNDTHVDLSTQTPNPVAGSSWSGTLSLKSSVSGYRLATTPSVKMNNVAVDFTATGNSWNPSTGAMTIGNVTGNIVITSASVEIVAHRVANHFINIASTGDGYVEDGDDYTAVLSPTTGATSNGDLRVFVDGTPLEATDYTFDSATGALTIPATKITGDVDVCATASTGKITVTVKAGMSTTVEFKQNQWKAAFYSDTIDASESAEDATVVIDTVPKDNGIPTVTMWTFGTPAAIKSIDFGGCKTQNSGNHSDFSDLSGAESITGLAFVENPNVTIDYFFNNCSSLKGMLDLMIWRCDTDYSVFGIVRNCAADEIIMPYMPNVTDAKNTLQNTGIKRFTINKTGAISVIKNFAQNAPNLKFVDLSRANITSAVTSIEFFFGGTTPNGITLKIGEFDLSGVTYSPNHSIDTKVSKLICTTMVPPNSALLNYLGSSVEIYVPNSSVEAYKTVWASKASNIHPVSEYTE